MAVPEGPKEITRLLERWSRGDAEAFERLTPLVYRELHRLADAYLQGERPGHTLQPTALINEAYLRLLAQPPQSWQNRAHFVAIAARHMRHILVEHARRRRALRRGGGVIPETLDASQVPARMRDVVELSDELDKLASVDARKARVVELRYFGGLTCQETAEVLGVHLSTVERDLRTAEAWLRKQLA
jgi:RNA polymerase sigma factor (TIGR02999 family)